MQADLPDIWILTYLRPDAGSGVERFVSNLSRALTDHGFHIRVLDAQKPGRLGSFVLRFRPIAAWKVGRKLNQLAAPEDLVICNGYFSWNVNLRKKIVVFHGTELGRALATSDVTSRLRNLAVKTINARLDKKSGTGGVVVAVSETTRNELERLYRLRVEAVIPNGIDLEIYKPLKDKEHLRKTLGLPVDKFLILYAGPPDPRKGFDFIMRQLQPKLRENQCLVATVELSDHPGNVIALGRVPFDSIVNYYQVCDAFLMPSYYEGCSYAMAEALACGLPCVVSNVGSATDLLKDDVLSKYVMTKMDAEDYAKAFTSLGSAAEAGLVSNASRRFAESHFDIKDFNKRYLELIEAQASK